MLRAIVIFAFFISCPHMHSQVMWQFNTDTVVTWHYQEGDEFNGPAINNNYWNYIIWARSLYMNREQQYYTDGNNLETGNGILKMIARKEAITARTVEGWKDEDSLFSGKKFVGYNKRTHPYTSGRLTSKGTFNKGYFECRFRIPSQHGYWPAFWLHGGAPNEEIDMMECQTSRPTQIHVDTHCPNHCDMVWRNVARESFGAWINAKTDFTKEFNVIACEWDERYVKFFLNGEFVAISKVNFTIPKHLTINMAVPSTGGPFGPGPTGGDTSAVFEVDYVRVWSKEKVSAAGFNYKDCLATLDTANVPMESSILEKRGRSYYGKKKHANKEGIKISLFRDGNNMYFSLLGNTRGELPELIINDGSGIERHRQKLNRPETAIRGANFASGTYELQLSWQGKTTRYSLSFP